MKKINYRQVFKHLLKIGMVEWDNHLQCWRFGNYYICDYLEDRYIKGIKASRWNYYIGGITDVSQITNKEIEKVKELWKQAIKNFEYKEKNEIYKKSCCKWF